MKNKVLVSVGILIFVGTLIAFLKFNFKNHEDQKPADVTVAIQVYVQNAETNEERVVPELNFKNEMTFKNKDQEIEVWIDGRQQMTLKGCFDFFALGGEENPKYSAFSLTLDEKTKAFCFCKPVALGADLYLVLDQGKSEPMTLGHWYGGEGEWEATRSRIFRDPNSKAIQIESASFKSFRTWQPDRDENGEGEWNCGTSSGVKFTWNSEEKKWNWDHLDISGKSFKQEEVGFDECFDQAGLWQSGSGKGKL